MAVQIRFLRPFKENSEERIRNEKNKREITSR
jgi:hypothetical protein